MLDRRQRGIGELLLLVAMYVAYSGSRVFASGDVHAARERAAWIERVQVDAGLNFEGPVNSLFSRVEWLAVFGSYWYATAHYVITAAVLLWVYRRDRRKYLVVRRALIVATSLALCFYLVIPTMPPRLFGGYTDVLASTASSGWWSGSASAPKGLGGLTNQFAAMPSMHAGWALWVAITVFYLSQSRVMRTLSIVYALVTGIVIIGTGNHWMLDWLAGWVVVGASFMLVVRIRRVQGQRIRAFGPRPGFDKWEGIAGPRLRVRSLRSAPRGGALPPLRHGDTRSADPSEDDEVGVLLLSRGREPAWS